MEPLILYASMERKHNDDDVVVSLVILIISEIDG